MSVIRMGVAGSGRTAAAMPPSLVAHPYISRLGGQDWHGKTDQ